MNFELIKGDITTMAVDAIVNAANKTLLGGGGVDGAIHRKGGPSVLEECIRIKNRQGGCKPGQAVITNAGNLPAKKIIHTVGPIWNSGKNKEEQLLHQCYTNSLVLAFEHGLKTIAFPNISTGVYHFPKDKAAAIAVAAVKGFEHAEDFDRIIFVCFDDENYGFYQKLLQS